MKKKTISRSSKTGKIVTKDFAQDNPDTTQTETVEPTTVCSISLVTDTFGNGELNILRDKLNEVIRKING